MKQLLALSLFAIVSLAAPWLAAKNVEKVWGDNPDRDQVVAAAIDVLMDKEPLPYERACHLLRAKRSPFTAQQKKRIRRIVASKNVAASRCATYLLYTWSSRRIVVDSKNPMKEDMAALRIGARSPDSRTRGHAVLGLVLAGIPLAKLERFIVAGSAFQRSANVLILERSASSVEDLMAQFESNTFSQFEIAEAIARWTEKQKFERDHNRFEKQRSLITEKLRATPKILGRSTFVQAIIALDPSTRELVSLFDLTEGYFEHVVILNAMRKRTPNDSWAVPRVLALLNAEDPLVFEVVSAMRAIGSPEYQPLIGYSLRRFLAHKTFGPAVGKYLATLESGPAWTVHALRNRLASAELMLVSLKSGACADVYSAPLRRTILELKPYNDMVYFKALALQHQCGSRDAVEARIVAFLESEPEISARMQSLHLVRSSTRAEILAALAETPLGKPTVEKLVRSVIDGSVRLDQVKESLRASSVEEHVRPFLDNPDAKKRRLALDILTLIAWSEESLQLVHDRLNDPDPQVRLAAVAALRVSDAYISKSKAALENLADSHIVAERRVARAAIMVAIESDRAKWGLDTFLNAQDYLTDDCIVGRCEPLQSLCRVDPELTLRGLQRTLNTNLRVASIRAAFSCPGTRFGPFIDALTRSDFTTPITEVVLKVGSRKQIRKALRADPFK